MICDKKGFPIIEIEWFSEVGLVVSWDYGVGANNVFVCHDPSAAPLFSSAQIELCVKGGWSADNPMFLFRPSLLRAANIPQANIPGALPGAEILERARIVGVDRSACSYGRTLNSRLALTPFVDKLCLLDTDDISKAGVAIRRFFGWPQKDEDKESHYHDCIIHGVMALCGKFKSRAPKLELLSNEERAARRADSDGRACELELGARTTHRDMYVASRLADATATALMRSKWAVPIEISLRLAQVFPDDSFFKFVPGGKYKGHLDKKSGQALAVLLYVQAFGDTYGWSRVADLGEKHFFDQILQWTDKRAPRTYPGLSRHARTWLEGKKKAGGVIDKTQKIALDWSNWPSWRAERKQVRREFRNIIRHLLAANIMQANIQGALPEILRDLRLTVDIGPADITEAPSVAGPQGDAANMREANIVQAPLAFAEEATATNITEANMRQVSPSASLAVGA